MYLTPDPNNDALQKALNLASSQWQILTFFFVKYFYT